MKTTLFIISFFFVFLSSAQRNPTEITDSIKSNFDYEDLRHHDCSNFPTGFYSMIFSLNEELKPVGFQFSIDSLALLKQIFIRAIQKTNFKNLNLDSSNSYVLLAFINPYAHCYDINMPEMDANNIWKAVAQFQDRMLKNVEKTFNKLQHSKQVYLLPPVFILNKALVRKGKKIDNFN
jgi:hypothetical protein